LYHLRHISLTQFRNFSQRKFNFDAQVIGITGLNGTGKTNLLDAVYYLCYTKSYFQSRESNNVQYGTTGFRIEGLFENMTADGNGPASPDTEKIVCIWKDGKKTIQHNSVLYERVTEHIGKYAAVMIAPDDIELLNGGSELRRKFIDGLLSSQPGSSYLNHLLNYQKYLAQRNAYLRQMAGPPRHDLLDVYDQQLALHGTPLIEARQKLSDWLPQQIQQFYHTLCKGSEHIDIHYKKCAPGGELARALAASRQRDIDYRRTLAGPHTEDWLIQIEGNAAKTHASQGQKKSMLIGLKLAHILWLQMQGKKPLLLLDDIFEKLDAGRLDRLFGLLSDSALAQVFMTHTSEKDLLQSVQPYYKQLQILPV
jgi:DNA replication and repair protein RecF